MIRCNLAVLLAEQNLKITKVSQDTGISRTTLTSLSNNYSQGIQLDTINKLCMYLRVEPGVLFSYIPLDIVVNDIHIDHIALEYDIDNHDWDICVNLDLKTVNSNNSFTLLGIGKVTLHKDGGIDVDFHLNFHENTSEIIINKIKQLRPLFRMQVEELISSAINTKLEDLDIHFGLEPDVKIDFDNIL